MPYIPPYKRNTQCNTSENIFNRNKEVNKSLAQDEQNEQKVEVNNTDLDVESTINFPSLLENTTDATDERDATDAIVNTMNFASSLVTPTIKEEIKKEVPDGWVIIKKNKEDMRSPHFIYGDHRKEYANFIDNMNYMEELRKERIFNRILDRYQEYEKWNYLVNGENYINSWEMYGYFKDRELDSKLSISENDSSDDDTSDEDMPLDE
jgi:hypothetical protein